MATVRTAKQRLVDEVEAAIAGTFPEIELVDLDVGRAGGTLTLYIDRAGGVDLDVCAAVSEALDGLRERYTLEVSSPGLDRRLRTAAHFAAVVGREIAVKLTTPREGRSNFRGVLTAADDTRITLALGDGATADLPLDAVATAHVIYDFEKNGGRRE